MKNSIDLVFLGYLKEYVGRSDVFHVQFQEGQTLRSILAKISVSEQIVGFATVNEKTVSLDYVPESGDQVKVFPLIIGG